MVRPGSRANGSPDPPVQKLHGGVGFRARNPRWHRIRTVRQREGMSLRTAARQVGATLRETRLQEDESTDLRLSDVYKWQAALGVPLVELLAEPETALSRTVAERARLVRLMKTAMALLGSASAPPVLRLAQNLVDQLLELMPELRDVAPWHLVGQRRSLEECGRIVERRISDDLFRRVPVERLD